MEKTEVRIVAGSLRGRKLVCHVHEGMRPTPTMVREALFSILGNAVPGREFFDIFAGTGVVGIEAVSRGASRTTFIERDPRLANDIQTHLDKFAIKDRGFVLRGDAYRWAERWLSPGALPVNLFFSPPFPDLSERQGDFLAIVNALLEKAPDESVLILQVEDGFPTTELPMAGAWDERRYGRNRLLFHVKGLDTPPTEGEDADDESD